MKRLWLILALASACAFAEALPRSEAKASIAIEGNEARALFDFSHESDFAAAAGTSTAMSKPALGSSFALLDAKDCLAFIGNGKMNDWLALKSKPNARILVLKSAPWSREDGVLGNSLLFALGTKWLRFITIAEPGNGADQENRSAVSSALQTTFRFGGMEIAVKGVSSSLAFAAGIADAPREELGEGWRAGTSFCPGSLLFTLASAATYSVEKLGAGAWLSGSAGYFESPGIAFAIEIATRDLKLGWGQSAHPAVVGASVFLGGSSQAYRTISGKSSPYDCFADLKVSLERGPLTFAMRALLYSLPENESSWSGRFLRNESLSPLQTLLWLWRTDIAKGSWELRILSYFLSAQALADPQGFRSASFAFGYAESADKASLFSINASFKIAFSREDASADEDEKLGSPEESESIDKVWQIDNFAADGLKPRSIDLQCGLSWRTAATGRVLQRGSLAGAIRADWSESQTGFSASFRIFQAFRASSRLDIALALKSPEGGYALGAVPNEFPCIAVEFSLWTG
ncbi:MAG: hypothetical protein WC820_03965 [Spirochaetales bacterium]